MIYASDLDQTLIYSLRSGRIDAVDANMTPAETIEDKVTSYISSQALMTLQAIAARIVFVPVTTRTVAQYRRIHLFHDHIRPDYAVTSNGGNLLIDGVPDQAWNLEVQRQVRLTSAPPEEVKELFEQVAGEDWVIGGNLCDGLFYSYRIHRDLMPVQAVKEFTESIRKLGWSTSIQGRKIYMVPNGVNKRDIILHLKERLGKQFVIASGDSLLDQCLLDAADYAIAAKHGELFRQMENEPAGPYTFTEASGIYAADEIVRFVHSTIESLAVK